MRIQYQCLKLSIFLRAHSRARAHTHIFFEVASLCTWWLNHEVDRKVRMLNKNEECLICTTIQLERAVIIYLCDFINATTILKWLAKKNSSSKAGKNICTINYLLKTVRLNAIPKNKTCRPSVAIREGHSSTFNNTSKHAQVKNKITICE